VNLAARVAARAAGGEVLVTREVRDAAGANLAFDHIGGVRLKGFDEATELFLARPARR
jgi:adenylate cyclase